jgi:DNA repair exonuclease SbcCD ATPase subunit
MAELDNDSDAILVHSLFGPDAETNRAPIDRDVLARIDAAAASLLGGEAALDALAGRTSDAEAESLTRELAARIRPILDDHLTLLEERLSARRAQAAEIEAQIEHLRAEASELERQLDREDEALVAEGAGCPYCGERNLDRLLIQDDGIVDCATCQRRYKLP